MVRKSVSCHQRDRFFTPCHCLVYQVSHKAFLPLFRMTAESKASSGSECEGSAVVVRKAVRCHQCNRFFTLCHRSVSLLSHTAFLPPFRMTIGGNGVIMRKTSGVIRSEREGSAAVVRKAVRCHPGNRILHSVSLSRFPAFSQSILTPVLNDDWRKARH